MINPSQGPLDAKVDRDSLILKLLPCFSRHSLYLYLLQEMCPVLKYHNHILSGFSFKAGERFDKSLKIASALRRFYTVHCVKGRDFYLKGPQEHYDYEYVHGFPGEDFFSQGLNGFCREGR